MLNMEYLNEKRRKKKKNMERFGRLLYKIDGVGKWKRI